MAELEFNIARLQQCLDVTVGTPSVGDVLTVSSTSPLEFDFGPNGGGTGIVNTITGNDPISVDNTDPANPVINIAIADKAQAGVVNDQAQEWWGVKTFDSLPVSFVDPIDSEQLTTKKYVDTFAAGLQVKAAVRAATLVPGTLASSFQNGSIIDGVTLITGDRILIKNQTNPVENGIFTVNVSGAPTRATDYDTLGEASAGTFTTVVSGSQSGKTYAQLETNPDPGVDPMNFTILNIGVAVTSIQSPNTTHGTSGTLIGAVKLDSTDVYYSGYTGQNLKTVVDLKAPKLSPSFTGTPLAPTANYGTNSDQIATTKFVQNALAGTGSTNFIKVSLSASQIKSANSTPVTVIAAPGAGKFIDIIDCSFRFNYIAPAYVNTQNFVLYNPSTNIPLVSFGYLSWAYSNISKANQSISPSSQAYASNEDVKFILNGVSDLFAGNSTLDMYITYRIITL